MIRQRDLNLVSDDTAFSPNTPWVLARKALRGGPIFAGLAVLGVLFALFIVV